MSILSPIDIYGDEASGKLPRMGRYMYDRLTGTDDKVCEAAIASAELWVASRLERAGITPDYDVPEVREAAILRTLYELYAFGESELQARDKKKEALLMLQTKYGSSVADDISDPGKSAAAGTPDLPEGGTAGGRIDWNGF